jgi:hypothetical protein
MTKPRSTSPRRKKAASKGAKARKAKGESLALAPVPQAREAPRTKRPPNVGAVPRIPALPGDLPSVILHNEQEVFAHFERIDPRLAEAWKRDVVVHEGPITLRRIMHPSSFGGATHYAYVDRRLLWYLSHDPSDPLGARWDGYLASARDAPSGTTAVVVGRNIVAKKRPPQLGEGAR